MEKQVFKRPAIMKDVVSHYCPGCHHGIIHRLCAEAIEELDIVKRTVLISTIGCSVLAYDYFDLDTAGALHGRGPAMAAGLKRTRPDQIVWTYQGDGDLAAIGTGEIIHAAARGENITVIFVNNAIYGMTGGQMAPTTLVGQKTTTCADGRRPEREGGPIRMTEIIAGLDGTAYAARASLHSVRHIREAKKALRRAFEVQEAGQGLGFVELLSGCPTNWRMDPIRANERIANEMIPVFPLGVFKDVTAGEVEK